METKKIILLILIIFLLVGNFALTQESKKNLTRQEEIPQPTYEVEVVVTNVDVIVTDKDGNHVTGLKPENFKIYEDDYVQKLTNFYEVKGLEVYASVEDKEKRTLSVSPQPLPEKSPRFRNKIIIYFDNWHLHPLNRNWSIKKLETFIKNNFSSEESSNQGMIVCLGQKLEIIQEFTSNPGQLLQAIQETKKYSGQSLLRKRTKEDLRKELNRIVSDSTQREDRFDNFDIAMSYARNYVESEQNDLVYSLKSMHAFMDYLAGIEGKKILIYVSDGLPINPSEEAFSFIDQAFPTGNARMETINYDATRLFKELAARCNANEITLYPINAQGLESMILSADKEAGWDFYSRGSGMVKATSRLRNDALKLMAHETGGLALLDTNDIESGLKKIRNDLQFYYSLGYRSPHRDDTKYHSIQVKLVGVDEEYNVRVRRGYAHISEEGKIEESVLSRLYLKRSYNPMNIRVQILPLKPMPGTKKLCLTLKILIPIKNLALIPQKDGHAGQIKAYIALMDAEGRLSPCHKLAERIFIPSQDYEKALQSAYPYLAEMYVDPGSYTISLAVKDVPGEVLNYVQFEQTIQ